MRKCDVTAAGSAVTVRSLVAAVALALAAPACAGSGGDKAGGEGTDTAAAVQPVGAPVTLRLLTVDELWASEFAAAAARLSGGSIRIDVRVGGKALLDYERRLVQDVRAGEGELASVGARMWDTMGVTSFRALVAPFLVESLAHQQRVLESPLVERMLAGLEPLDLVGLAVLPGPLRRPFGVSRPLLGPGDYAGATFGVRYGRVARATLEALGAEPRGYRIGSVAGLDGAELDAATIDRNGYWRDARALTANVVLWARPETIVISRAALERLPAAQQRILRRAGREALAPTFARLEKEAAEALAALCDGALALSAASAAELSTLRAAVRPVHEELQRDAETKELLTEIGRLADGTEPETLRCSGESTPGISALEGRWRTSATREQLLEAGASPEEARFGWGTATIDLRDGKWRARSAGTGRVWTGTYAVTGRQIALRLETCSHNPCTPGAGAEHRWSVYRDKLTFKRLPGRGFWWQLAAKPWTRAS